MSSDTQGMAERLAQAQLDAYNAGDIDAFIRCYAQDVKVWDLLSGSMTYQGIERMRERYGDLFARAPELHAELTGRLVLGPVAVDRERVTGLVQGEVVEAIATYEVRDGLIRQVWFVRA